VAHAVAAFSRVAGIVDIAEAEINPLIILPGQSGEGRQDAGLAPHPSKGAAFAIHLLVLGVKGANRAVSTAR
jgi:hypothetical protein